jgi:redox-sensing transcriptional repressor
VERKEEYISSETIGKKAGVPGTQVRKDLLGFKAKGRPSLGFHVKTLRDILKEYLGLNRPGEAALIGAGNLGKALARFNGFRQYNLNISLIFDNDPRKVGSMAGDLEIFPVSDLKDKLSARQVRIGIITTPASAAQEVAEKMIESGIIAIWNFTPLRLVVPDNIYVRYEDLSAGLALLAHKAAEYER